MSTTAPSLPPPLTETDYAEPFLIPTLGLGPTLNTNNVLWYFMNSPFYDASSNNQALLQYASSLPPNERTTIFNNRVAFEEALRKHYPSGRQFVVISEAKKETDPWVVQRQNVQLDERRERVVEVEATYYTIGGVRWVQAPSLREVVDMRLLQTTRTLLDIFTTIQPLTTWSPSTSHTYLPPNLPSKSTLNPTTTTTNNSTTTSRAPSPTADSQLHPQPQTTTTDDTTATPFNESLLLSSFTLTDRYGDEFADENPLKGEPGALVFSSTAEQVKARNKAAAATAEAMAHAAAREQEMMNARTVGVGVGGIGGKKAAVPGIKPLSLDTKIVGLGGGKGSAGGSAGGSARREGKKRRKSKGASGASTPAALGGGVL